MRLRELCEGRMLPPVDIGKEHYSALFDLCVSAVAEVTGVTSEEIMGRRRPRAVADARMMVYKMARHEIGVGTNAIGKCDDNKCPSLLWIGKKFGRDHGSVLHGVSAMSSHLSIDKKLYALYVEALEVYEISRAKYLSIEVRNVTDLQVHALQETIETIKESIRTHENALADTEKSLEEAKGGSNENMVQEQCASNG